MMNMLPSASKIQDFMSAHATPDTDCVQLSSGELDALQEQLRYALELLSDIICMSEHHAHYFRHCPKDEVPPPEDLEVLEEQAIVIMEKGEFVFSLIEEIDDALEARYESQFDDLLAALESDNKHQDRS